MLLVYFERNEMVVSMVLFWIPLVLSVIGTHAAGEFSVLYSPDSLKFTPSEKTLESLLRDIFSAALGLSVEENPNFKGMYIMDPFNTPEAVVEVYIDGVSNLGENAGLKTKTYSLTVDEYEPDTFEGIKHRIKQRFTSGGNKIANIKLSDDTEPNTFKDVFGDFTSPNVIQQNLVHLKHTVEEDYHFLNELATLRGVIGRVQSGALIPDNIIDFYNIRFRTLHALSDFYGPNSVQTKEAKKLLGDALQDLSKAFVKAYDGSVLVTAVTTDVAHTRRAARSLDRKNPDPPVGGKDTIAPKAAGQDEFDPDYGAVFNILLWSGVMFTFSLLAIINACMDMDPGRDSIIYRMTSTRMKKDN